jgi:hypothetical protein
MKLAMNQKKKYREIMKKAPILKVWNREKSSKKGKTSRRLKSLRDRKNHRRRDPRKRSSREGHIHMRKCKTEDHNIYQRSKKLQTIQIKANKGLNNSSNKA